MNMKTTRNLSFYGISLFLSLAAAFGSPNAAYAQKAKKNKKKPAAQTVTTEAAPAESVIVNTIDPPSDQNIVPQIYNRTEEALNAQLQTKLKFTPYTRSAPVKPNVFGNYPNIKNAPAWDGREPGNYSIRFKFKTITPPKATPKITNICCHSYLTCIRLPVPTAFRKFRKCFK